MTFNLTHSCLPEFAESLDEKRNHEERNYLLFLEYAKIDLPCQWFARGKEVKASGSRNRCVWQKFFRQEFLCTAKTKCVLMFITCFLLCILQNAFEGIKSCWMQCQSVNTENVHGNGKKSATLLIKEHLELIFLNCDGK